MSAKDLQVTLATSRTPAAEVPAASLHEAREIVLHFIRSNGLDAAEVPAACVLAALAAALSAATFSPRAATNCGDWATAVAAAAAPRRWAKSRSAAALTRVASDAA